MADKVWAPERGLADGDLRPRKYWNRSGAAIPKGMLVEFDTTNHGIKKITDGGQALGITKNALADDEQGIVWTAGQFRGVAAVATGETVHEGDRICSASTDGTVEVQATGGGYAIGTGACVDSSATATGSVAGADCVMDLISSLDFPSTV